MVEPIQAKNGTFVVIDLRNWPNLGGTTGEPAAPRLIAELPKEELYSLTDQIRRASRSVCTNMAEGWCKRRYQRHFISKFTDADGEAAETRVLLHFAFRCGYLEESEFIELDETYDRIMGGLVNMMTHPNKWCGPAHLVREDVAAYHVDR